MRFYVNANVNANVNAYNGLTMAQNRRVPGDKNKNSVRDFGADFSAQGYKLGNDVVGFNESGASAINYLWL